MKLFATIIASGLLALGVLTAADSVANANISNTTGENQNSAQLKLSPERQEYYREILKERQKINSELQSHEQMRSIKINSEEAKNLKEKLRKIPSKKLQFDPSIYKHNPTSDTTEKKTPKTQKELTQLPNNIRYVGEFEESQAVMVAFPSTPVYSDGEGLYPLITTNFGESYYNNCKPGEGIWYPYYWGMSQDEEEVYLVPISMWVANIGLFQNQDGTPDTTEAYVWTNLINAIQKECQVWIRLTGLQDSTVLKNYMAQRNMPLENYRFFSEPTGEDAFWARDWAPHGFYYTDENTQTQKLAFHEALYYTGRPFDDVFPRKVLTEVGYDYYDLQVKMEGGNIMTDGYGDATYGDVIYGNNDTVIYQGQKYPPVGQYYYSNGRWNLSAFKALKKNELDTKMKKAFNLNNPNLVQSLQYDGGTGHIDLWIKQFDEETMLIANMPEKYSSLVDYKIIQKNREYLKNKKTSFGTNYRFLNAPMPKRFDGPYPTVDGEMPANNTQYDKDPRGYLNGLVVNKSYIYPAFSQTPADPCWKNDSISKEILKKILPGYNLVPIDARSLTPGGGAIHCITMQIPQDPNKLITIKHKPIRDAVELSSNFSVEAELTVNTLGANKVILHWQKNNFSNAWNSVEMQLGDDGKYHGEISDDFVESDTIRYYISAQKDSEVRKCAPITAPDGYYEFYFGDAGVVDKLYGFDPSSTVIASVYPNPALEYINIIFENNKSGNVSIEIYNSIGELQLTPIIEKYFERGVFTVDINNLSLPVGSYFIKMTSAEGISFSNFIISER